MRMLKYILEVVWYIMWEILVAPMRMLKYILEIVWYIIGAVATMRMLKYFRTSRNIWRGSTQKSIEGHQKRKVRRREEVVEVTDSCFKNYLICWD